MKDHFDRLASMYRAAPIHQEQDISIQVQDGTSAITLMADARWHHAGQGLHGSILFKLLDDAAYFAAASLETEWFVVTSQFSIQFVRPFTEGKLLASGEVFAPGKTVIHARSEVRDERQRLLASGTGTFARSRLRLVEAAGYKSS